MKNILIAVICVFVLASCDHQPTSDEIQHHAQEAISAQGNSAVGMPSIVNFQEKRMAKMILELRDTALTTYTYTQDMNGKMHKLCDSVGYGLPYSTQYTNPQRISEVYNRGIVTLPQADPNGLFSPPQADGTWVLCLNPKTSKAMPLYIEPKVIVSPFPLD